MGQSQHVARTKVHSYTWNHRKGRSSGDYRVQNYNLDQYPDILLTPPLMWLFVPPSLCAFLCFSCPSASPHQQPFFDHLWLQLPCSVPLRQGSDHRDGKGNTTCQRMTSAVLGDSWSKKMEYQQLSGPGCPWTSNPVMKNWRSCLGRSVAEPCFVSLRQSSRSCLVAS